MGDRGCLSLFGDNAETHRLFAEHLTSEYRVKTQGRGRTVDEWKMRPERGDNHWFDGLVGCAVAASMQGVERTKMVYSFPADEKKWQRYSELRAESLRAHGDIRLATDFYAADREAMDAGAKIAWVERFNHDELSAIQHAMNLRLQDEAAFYAEYQNEPLPEETADGDELTADQVATKTNRMQRSEVAVGCNHLTMFIDVQANLLFFVVVAWEGDFTGQVIDYGTFPDQKRPHFTLRDARHTLASVTKSSEVASTTREGTASSSPRCCNAS